MFDCFRLVLVDPVTRQIFAERYRLVWKLPRISIPRWSRPAEQLQSVIAQQWGFKAVVIDLLEEEPGREPIAIAELRSATLSSSLSRANSWLNVRKLSKNEIDGANSTIVEILLKDGATGRGPFSRFGWIEEAQEWIGAEAGIDETQFTGEANQFNAAAKSVLVRFGRKSDSPVWFKAAGDPSSSEYRVTATLSQLFPDFLPVVLATREDRKAWWMEDGGTPLCPVHSPRVFGKAISRLAEIQKASIGLAPSLLTSGCSDLRLSVLRASIPPLMDAIDDAMARQASGLAPRLTRARVRELESILMESCLSLESVGIPDTLLHGDISFENILVGPRGCVFIDWANAAIGNPFVTFEQLRAQIEQENDACIWLPMLTDIYCRSWLGILSRRQIECAFAIVPPIASMAYLFDQWKRLGSERRSEPKFQSYVRGLARQMDRAACNIELRRSRCA